jgi:hypothetical protein
MWKGVYEQPPKRKADAAFVAGGLATVVVQRRECAAVQLTPKQSSTSDRQGGTIEQWQFGFPMDSRMVRSSTYVTHPPDSVANAFASTVAES